MLVREPYSWTRSQKRILPLSSFEPSIARAKSMPNTCFCRQQQFPHFPRTSRHPQLAVISLVCHAQCILPNHMRPTDEYPPPAVAKRTAPSPMRSTAWRRSVRPINRGDSPEITQPEPNTPRSSDRTSSRVQCVVRIPLADVDGWLFNAIQEQVNRAGMLRTAASKSRAASKIRARMHLWKSSLHEQVSPTHRARSGASPWEFEVRFHPCRRR